VNTEKNLYKDIEEFVKLNNYNSLINSCDLSKGNCDTVSKKLYQYLLSIGYDDNDLQEIELLNPKFDTDEAHPEWQKFDKKFLGHVILKVGKAFVDLTGSQYSKSQSGIKIYTIQELGKLWGKYKIMKKDSEGKYIGGDYSRAKIRNLVRETLLEYTGGHEAPDKDNSPMHDLEGTYPDDIYSEDAARMYGDHGGNSSDIQCIAIIRSAKGRPRKQIRIYRAVPYLNKDIDKQIKELNAIYNYKVKFGFFPMKNEIVHGLEDKYQDLPYDEMNAQILKDIGEQSDNLRNQRNKSPKINNGDWVTISKEYAKEHGLANVPGGFKITTKVVRADQLYTFGDSIYEWGYNV